MITFKQKILLISGGLVFVVILLELVLRLGGGFYSRYYLPHYDFRSITGDTYNILCLGDSYTYGIGAGIEHSYPAQLQEILNRNNPGKKFKVLNLGVPGFNSAQVLQTMNGILPGFKPDMIVVMVSCNDFYHFDAVLCNSELAFLGVKHKLRLSRLKVLKFFGIILENIKAAAVRAPCDKNLRDLDQKLEEARQLKLDKEYEKAVTLLSGLFCLYPDNRVLQGELDDACIRNNDIDASIRCYSALLERFPENVYLQGRLSDCYRYQAGEYFIGHQLDKAIHSYQQAFLFNPGDTTLDSRPYYAAVLLKSEAKNRRRDASAYGRKETLRATLNNFEQIALACRKNNIALIFSGYPDAVPYAMQKTADKYGVALVDHQPDFKALLRIYPLEKLFVSPGDSHCTQWGYRVMAENIAETVVRLKNGD